MNNLYILRFKKFLKNPHNRKIKSLSFFLFRILSILKKLLNLTYLLYIKY